MGINVLWASLHDLAFSAYIGGLIYMEVVMAPAQRAIAPAQAAVISRKAGDRQAIIAWTSLLLLLVTGVLRLSRSGSLEFPGTFGLEPDLAASSYGKTILLMFGLWCVLVGLGLVMTFVLRPILIGKIDPTLAAAEQEQRKQRMMTAARWMGVVLRVDLAVVVAVAVLGASLRYGGVF